MARPFIKTEDQIKDAINFRMTKIDYALVKRYCFERNITMSNLIRERFLKPLLEEITGERVYLRVNYKLRVQ